MDSVTETTVTVQTQPAPQAEAPKEPTRHFLLPANLACLAKLVGDEHPKFGTNGVQLTRTAEGYRAEATNGRYLGIVKGPNPGDPAGVTPAAP